MHQTRHRIILLTVAAVMAGAIGCETDPDNNNYVCQGGKCDDMAGPDGQAFEHRWAIDMAKVRTMPGTTEKVRIMGASADEFPLPPELFGAACQREAVIGADGSVSEGECLLWGNMQTLNYNHSVHVDDPANNPIVNIVDGDQQIDPPGYLNIIALLNADRHEQTEIRRYVRNGDIFVYVHPNDDDTTQFRMHHAAMYYDTGEGTPLLLDADGNPFVHHLDNPTSYGPALNAGPSSPPFHVFRLNPNGGPNIGNRDAAGLYRFPCTEEVRNAPAPPAACAAGEDTFTISDEMAVQYNLMARNWALILNEHAPFADFHFMSWNDAGQRAAQGISILPEVDRWAYEGLRRGMTPEVYCAGLVFSNLNLALNRPLNRAALGDLADTFYNNEFGLSDGYMNLGEGPNQTRGALTPQELEDTQNLPNVGRLAFEPVLATDIVDAWIEGYFGRLPREHRAGILAQAAPQLAGGFTSLGYADEAFFQQYAQAYGAGGEIHEQMRQQVAASSSHRYVAPPLYHVLANQQDSLISYVGTVIHVDLLTAIGTNDGSNTGSGDISEFSQGGPDATHYPHYAVPNDGRHVQRIFNVDSGPESFGYGSRISTRISAANILDVRIILHPAGTFTAADTRVCEQNATCLGNVPGIPVPLELYHNGGSEFAWDDISIDFDLFETTINGGLGCIMEDGRRLCPLYDWDSGEAHLSDVLDLDGNAHGLWALTVVDLGMDDAGQNVEYCDECPNGGAHTNQWVLTIRDDEAATE